jgi:hypothetical protein
MALKKRAPMKRDPGDFSPSPLLNSSNLLDQFRLLWMATDPGDQNDWSAQNASRGETMQRFTAGLKPRNEIASNKWAPKRSLGIGRDGSTLVVGGSALHGATIHHFLFPPSGCMTRKKPNREINLERKVLKIGAELNRAPSVTEGRESRAYLVNIRDSVRAIKYENSIHITVLISHMKDGNSLQE